jgi:quercetin dioxygenase-like cupin family protein
MNTHDLSRSVIFPKGEKVAGGHFTGDAWLEMLVPADGTSDCTIGNVTYQQGSRSNWHSHTGRQVILVTGGKGYFQEYGKPARALKQGDVVKIDPGVKHWHGAAPDSWLVHIAVSSGRGETTLAGPVTDEEYRSLK